MEELNDLTKQYYNMRDELKEVNSKVLVFEQLVADTNSRLTMLNDKCNQLTAKQYVVFTLFLFQRMKGLL